MSEGKYFECKGEIKLREIGLESYNKLCEGCLDYIQTEKRFEIFYKLHGIDNGKLEEMSASADGEKHYAKCPLAKKIISFEETDREPPKPKGIGINV